MTERLTTLRARRIALAAQGFTRPRPRVPPARRHLASVVDRLGFFQIDSVNILQRAHYLPLYSRLGPYDIDLLHRAAGRAPRMLVEYWAHEAALVDVRLWPALRFRMAERRGMWGGPRRIGEEQPGLLDRVRREVRDGGGMTAREIERRITGPDAHRRRDHWGWNWSDVKQALEHLFFIGDVTAARRTAQFERIYDLPERVLPAPVLATPALEAHDAHLHLLAHAARALGVGTAQCLRDYFRLAPDPTTAAIETLVETGELIPVEIAGWNRPAYRHVDAVTPRRVDARALLSPFDPLVFERTRTEKLFGFRYRIEIYVPRDRRVHGYYALPFLLGDALVARVDLKADRAAGILDVLGAWAEDGAPASTANELAAELRQLAGWLGLDDIRVRDHGDLAAPLTAAVVTATPTATPTARLSSG